MAGQASDHSTKEKSIISSKSFLLATARMIKKEDETLPRVIARKFKMFSTKNKHNNSMIDMIIFLTGQTIWGGKITGLDIV